MQKTTEIQVFRGVTSQVTWSHRDSSSGVDPTGEYGGNLSDVLNSQSQPVAEDSLANELCGRAWTFPGMESVCIEGSQVKTGCFMTFKMC